jgi:diacylglycerol O-acyltransferase
LLTVLDIAFDRYLREQKTIPAKPVVIDMPVALSGAGGGNQITMLQVPLGRPGATPDARLAAVRANTASVKREMAGQTNDAAILFGTLADAFLSLVERVGLGRRWKLANAVVSNPFGMTERCYLMGAEVELVLPMSLVPPGQTLNITAVTLVDKLQIGFLAVPDAVPHVERLAKYTAAAFPVLTSAFATPPKARQRAAAKPARRQPPRSKVPNAQSTTPSATNGRRRRTAVGQ